MKIGDRVKVISCIPMSVLGHVGKEFTITDCDGKFAYGKTDRGEMLVIPVIRLNILAATPPPKSLACPKCGQMADIGNDNVCFCLKCGVLFDDAPDEGGTPRRHSHEKSLRVGGGKMFNRRIGRR